MKTHRLIVLAWPAFIAAGILEMLVFSFVDPTDFAGLGVSSLGVYSIAFLVLWVVVSAASAMSYFLISSASAEQASDSSGHRQVNTRSGAEFRVSASGNGFDPVHKSEIIGAR